MVEEEMELQAITISTDGHQTVQKLKIFDHMCAVISGKGGIQY
jgi:hypothetical protein